MSDTSGTLPNGISGTGPLGDTRFSFSRPTMVYSHPFLDMTSTMLPKSIKGMIQFIAAFILSDGFLNQCIKKQAEYPITDILYRDLLKVNIVKDNTIKTWKDITQKRLKLKQNIHQIGMNFYGYGNSLVSINFPFKRVLKCTSCNHEMTPESVKDLVFKSYSYEGICNKCEQKVDMDHDDLDTKELSKLNYIHWDLPLINIKYNNTNGEHFYYYSVPVNISNKIKNGDLDIVNGTRKEFIEAVRLGKQVRLKTENLIHFKCPSPQHNIYHEAGWGVPQPMVVIKDVFHCKILKKANEAISFDRIVPWTILFPNDPSGDVTPHGGIALAPWAAKVQEEIRKKRIDPNYISIMPVPIGYVNIGGDGKLLLCTQEIRATEDTIITGLGVIPEIIRGGASWSGSNISLRIVENSFLTWRATMQEFLDWTVEMISKYFDIPPIELTMSKFKMADDLQKNSLIANLAGAPPESRIVSQDTARDELGYNSEEEIKKITEETNRATALFMQSAEIASIARGNASLVDARYNADSQAAFNRRNDENFKTYQEDKAKNKQLQLDTNYNKILHEIDPTGLQNISVPGTLLIVTQRMLNIAKMDPDQFRVRMLTIRKRMPYFYAELYSDLSELNELSGELLAGMAPAGPPMDDGSGQQGGQPGGEVVGQGQGAQPPMPDQLPEQKPPRSPNAPV